MPDRFPATLAGILMDDEPDADGIRWRVLGDIDGWDDAPVREDEQDLTGRHGGWGSDPLYGARLLTLPGRAHSPDVETAFTVRDRLMAALPLGQERTLIVHEPVPKMLTVRRGRINCSLPRGAGLYRVTFQIPLVARNPYKTALAASTVAVAAGATVPVETPGTAAAELVVTTTSAGTVDLTVGGLRFTTSALPSGAVIDIAAATVTSGGVELPGVVLRYGFPALPAGGGAITQAGTAALSIRFFHTYA